MAQKIKSLTELAEKLSVAEVDFRKHSYTSLVNSCLQVQATAKKKFGQYQPAFGKYPAWAKLAEVTIARKARAGGDEDPLIGHYPGKNNRGSGGALRKSILIKVKGLTGVVGTNDPLAKYHEYGTKHIPPRPFLRPALFQEQKYIKDQLKEAIAKTLLGL